MQKRLAIWQAVAFPTVISASLSTIFFFLQ
jgi:hypothetical protein